MQIIQDIETIKEPFKSAVITIGNFDGVHIGHQALFHEVIERAEAMDGTAIAMTFDPHPIRVIKRNGNPPLITLYEQKAELIEKAGIDVLICIPFTMDFAALSARTFVEEILVKRIGMKAIVVGQDYTFGNRREGNVELLKQYAAEMGFEVIVAEWIQSTNADSDRISSTAIRELVMEGDMEKAGKMLGRNYQIRGTVARGRDRGGKLLGIPTANINLQDELCPKAGVYAVIVNYNGRRYPGVANIGYSPTFDDNVFTVEAHILGFKKDIYGEKIMVNFVQRLRGEIKFSGIDELIEQIDRDIAKAREILAPHLKT
ncbi:riboflavin biosynthesis protein [Desulfosarcina widdelii]|uniref:Riboflavin biosynthesis protein n=1 Tax=Desulfosarcina widdelii TaxID=947919 RepID=A0A5K7YY47_9BACT|nr:bifunctional riboflavin kinase/FAD synthetase [Desulfosarcina widdelii]BBO72833.1 riboflavin biosynthesis protein [Desulfosarcina widdelii]